MPDKSKLPEKLLFDKLIENKDWTHEIGFLVEAIMQNEDIMENIELLKPWVNKWYLTGYTDSQNDTIKKLQKLYGIEDK